MSAYNAATNRRKDCWRIIMQRRMSGEGLSDGYASGENEQKDCWRIMQPEGLSAKDCQRIMQPQMSGRNVGI